MSCLFGSWNYHIDGDKDISNCILQQMYDAISFFPHEKYNSASHQNVNFGHLLTYNTPQSIYEEQPYFLRERQLLFVMQGRIDNRDRLATMLNIKINESYTDSALTLQAFLHWGKSCVHYLRGDWSFAAFDYRQQELFIARDPMGYTAIYYYQDDTGFYFSSAVKSLLNLKNYKKKLNEEHFIRTLTVWDDDTLAAQSTFFKDIFSLPSACCLIVKNKMISSSRFWEPQSIKLRYYKNKQDYADEMLDIFTSAVQARMRSNGPVASMLSGGLDSSTVSYIAADLLKEKNSVLTTLSHVPLFVNEILQSKEGHNRILDESPFILKIAEASGNIKPLLLNSSDYSVLRGMRDALHSLDAPSHASGNLYWVLDIYQTTAKNGFSTLLSGEGGNCSISYAGKDYLLPASVSTFIRHPFDFFKKQVAKPLVLKYFNRQYNDRIFRSSSRESYISNVCLQPGIENKYGIIEDIRKNNKTFIPYISNIQEQKLFFIDLLNIRGSIGAARGDFFGFDLRDPTRDVEVMEYFFSIPNEAFFDEHYNNRMLVKRMMKGKIPNSVLFEEKKGLQSADIVYRVKTQADEITACINSIRKSPAVNFYIDTNALYKKWQLYIRQPSGNTNEMHDLLKALQFAMFLQMHFD